MTSPQLEQYPGYFPEGSRRFWTRTKVGIVAGLVGLLVGVGGSGEDPVEAPPAVAADPTVEAELEQALEDNSELEESIQEARDDADDEVRAVTKQLKKQARTAQRSAVQAAVAKVRTEERRKTAAAVKAARAAAAPAPTAASAPVPLASTSAATDPRFSYCYEANDAGFGPYYRGQDPEYDWYDDNDNDGIVCET